MNQEELIKQNIEVLKAEERNLTMVLRRIQGEIAEATSNKKKIADSIEALSEDKKVAVEDYQGWVNKVEDLKTQFVDASKAIDEVKVEANKIRADISAERGKIDVERFMLEQEKEAHQVEKSNLADDKRDFQTKVEKLNKALE